ncbi:hypothetical protein PGRAT_13405 [Paenibacillus graminis]|uniref:EAL domain-containing protein n=1 Tax=Paenibacillus graminis TaxID=189425 RepID=A0A089NHH1_9BACL|nr:hypothetical protein PGRAT_13405 [Paenibacillus graminis]
MELISEYASRSATRVIAEGNETEEELLYLQMAGIEFGQATRSEDPDTCLYRELFRRIRHNFPLEEATSMFLQIGEIAEQIPETSLHHKCAYVDHIFNKQSSAAGCGSDRHRTAGGADYEDSLYQQIGTLYGFTLYMGCSIELIMDGSLLVKATGCFRPQQRF